MLMLNPKLSILDETDSGLDIDALKIVASGVNKLRSENNSFIIITHYQRLLDYIKQDFVHVLSMTVIKSGGPKLPKMLEEKDMIGSKKNQPQFNFDKKSNFISDFLPSIKNEDWKYTNLKNLFQKTLKCSL